VATRPSISRLAAWLLVTARTDRATLPRPQDRLAHELGMTRVTLNRCLHRLVEANIITLDGQTVTVRDPSQLQRLTA
jgi:CRP-like cAMP-binding protein